MGIDLANSNSKNFPIYERYNKNQVERGEQAIQQDDNNYKIFLELSSSKKVETIVEEEVSLIATMKNIQIESPVALEEKAENENPIYSA